MKIVFRGVRGSLPTPYTENLEYGGNTACVEIRSSSGDIVALDGGTGLRDVGLALTEEFGREGMEIDILLSHYHWDHIQGIPFFDPLFVSGNRVRVFGHGSNLEKTVTSQMREPYFPVDFSETGSRKEFISVESASFRVGTLAVHPFRLNHPQGATGYRLESEEGTVTYATDLEHGDERCDRILREYAQNYSTWLEATLVAADADVGQLVLFHHDPSHSDSDCDEIAKLATRYFPESIVASEDLVIEL
jgi:phosphoribosyl 1,2-cyclic phosphodiesterase